MWEAVVRLCDCEGWEESVVIASDLVEEFGREEEEREGCGWWW